MGDMNLEALKKSLIAHEGRRPKMYRDTQGKLTIGVGRNLTDGELSDDEIDLMLDNDIRKFCAAAQKEDWWPSVTGDDVRGRAMVELCFNLGIAKLRQFTKALAALHVGDFETCANELRNSKWFRQVGAAPGQRGYTLVEMIRTGREQ